MRKRLVIFFALCGLLFSAFTAQASASALPENDFFHRHRDDCVYLGRSFRVNGADGFVSAKKEPGSKTEIAVFENGKALYLEYSCLYKGEFWGLASFLNPDETAKEYLLYGWVRISELLVFYDYVAFEEEFFAGFYQYGGDYEEIKKAGQMIAWTWPGSGIKLWTILNITAIDFRVSRAYTDAAGNEWGFIAHIYDSDNIWVCLSDPVNTDLPALKPPPEPQAWESETGHTDIGKMSEESVILIFVLGFALLIAGAAVFMRMFKRRAA